MAFRFAFFAKIRRPALAGRIFFGDFYLLISLIRYRIRRHTSVSDPHKSAHMQYELLFLVGHDKEAELATIEKNVEGFIAEIGGEIKSSRWESKRHLAYPIKHQERGVYIARRFELPEYDMWAKDAQPQEIDRITKLSRTLRLFRDVLRFTIVRSDDLEDLEKFSNRKEEERKSHKQAVIEKEIKAKRAATPRPTERKTPSVAPEAPVVQSVQQEAPKKEVSVAEINEKLDEILNG